MDLMDYYELVYKYCLVKTKNTITAEDITQECFEVYLKKRKEENIEKIDHFLLKVAKNLCNKEFSNNNKIVLMENVDLEVGYSFNEDDIITEKEIEIYKEKILSSLSQEEKIILDHYYNKKENIKSIAKKINKTEWAVYKAKQKLEKKIKINIIKIFQK